MTDDGIVDRRRSTLDVGTALWAKTAARTVKLRSDLAVVVLDVTLLSAAFAAALLVRFDGGVSVGDWERLAVFLPYAALVFVVANWAWGLYGQLWRHASLYEARRLVMSGLTATIVLTLFEWLGPRNAPLSVVMSGGLLGTFLMALLRFQSRLFSFRRAAYDQGLRVVVIGSGDAGASLVADMLRSPRAGFKPVAVLD